MDLFGKSEIEFDEKEHKYVTKKGKKPLISTTQLIHKYTPPFDPTGEILIKCAAKEGVTPEELKAKWEKIKDDACERGTNFHTAAEKYIKTGVIEGPDSDIIQDFAEKCKFKGQLLSEARIYNLDLMIAGTVDLIEIENDLISIYDFKTNKKLKRFAFKGETMLPPIQTIPNANYFHYCLQLNTYAYLLELADYYVKGSSLKLYYINPETRKIEIHPIPDMRNDVIKMIEHYKNAGKSKPRKQSYEDWVNDLFEF